jgi:hypothetical protein
MFSEKRKFALWARQDTLDLVEKFHALDGCKSKSAFIERAVRFYAGYLSQDKAQEYLPRALTSTMRGILDSQEERVCSLLFKLAVETAMMLHVTAAANEIESDTLVRLRGRCVDEVKRLRGRISFDEAARFQK